jgi:hypothetical protein
MGHYPFTDDFTLGCGGPELGTKLDPAKMAPLPAADGRKQDEPAGWVDSAEPKGKGTLVRGWATGAGPDDPVRCVVHTSAAGEVTGGGQYQLPRPDVASTLNWVGTHAGFAVIAPTDKDGRVVVILESGRMLWLPGRAPAAE